jgi:hypothetical protein
VAVVAANFTEALEEKGNVVTKKQVVRLNMIRSVLWTLSSETEEKNHKAIWFPVKGFADAVSDLREVVTRIDTLLKVQEGKDDAAAEKAQALQVLGDAAYEIAAATKSCAVATGNTFLAWQVDFSRAQVTQDRDATVSARCQAILDTASGVADSLKDYDITTAKLTKYKAAPGDVQQQCGDKGVAGVVPTGHRHAWRSDGWAGGAVQGEPSVVLQRVPVGAGDRGCRRWPRG